MGWQIIVALVVIVPVILIPVMCVWYLTVTDALAAVREVKARRVTGKKRVEAIANSSESY
ncbi:MAG: hypothetical protein JW712_01085 [Dehalococcoidales bacterium]|nr:hypothetical protein [Dehalococcoidales bacterium]